MIEPLPPFSKKAVSLKPGNYEHYKGMRCEILGVARHSETLEEVVVYREGGGLWVRPLPMFCEDVEIAGKKIPRFRYIG
jgi:hypothetical protein